MTLTEIDRRVLQCMAKCGVYSVPADIGMMMGGTVSGKTFQDLRRMGGREAKRLIEMGMVEDRSAMRGSLPAYRITALGRQVVAEFEGWQNDRD